MNALLLIVVATGASAVMWGWQNRRQLALRDRDDAHKKFLDGDVQIVLAVALHEANARSHEVGTLHLLYGLLQDDAFTDAITKLGGDVEAIEQRVHDRLGKLGTSDTPAVNVIARAVQIANQYQRKASRNDLWHALARTEAAKLVGDVAPMILFVLVHGATAPIMSADSPDVHVVLRNDDYTTREFVVEIVRDVFGIAEPAASELMMKTHTEGRAVIARLDAKAARAKLEIVRERARLSGFPLWVGAEAC